MSSRVKSPEASRNAKKRRHRVDSGETQETASANDTAALQIENSAFFTGVDEVRRYLDRHLQDPERRRDRLGRMVHELVRPRSASDLGNWLTRQLREALGAKGCALLLKEPQWRAWRTSGVVEGLPTAELLTGLRASSSANGAPSLVAGNNLLVGVGGTDGLLGALWLEDLEELDLRSAKLLAALSDTAGVFLEQGIKVEALSRDPRTGLALAGAFLAKASALSVPPDRTLLLMGFRVAGIEAIREAQGGAAEEIAMGELGVAVVEALPADAQLGAHFDTVLALRVEESGAAAEAAGASYAQTAILALRRRTASRGATLSATVAYLLLPRLPADLTPSIDRLMRHLNDAPTGSATRL